MINHSTKNVEPVLLRKVKAVIQDVKAHLPEAWDIRIFETDRTVIRQKMLFENGHSKTLHSKHLIAADKKCHAVDIVFWFHDCWTWTSAFWSLVENSKHVHGLKSMRYKGFVDLCHCELIDPDEK